MVKLCCYADRGPSSSANGPAGTCWKPPKILLLLGPSAFHHLTWGTSAGDRFSGSRKFLPLQTSRLAGQLPVILVCVSHPPSALRSKGWLLGEMDCGTCRHSCLSALTLRPARPWRAAGLLPALASTGVVVQTHKTLTRSPDSKGECR